jgi:hypothetical protein
MEVNRAVGERHRVGSLTILAFGLVAFSVLASQIVLSRLFAGTLTYYFAFMLISLAMLGLGSGGLLVQLASSYFSIERLGVQAFGFSLAMGLSGIAGTLAMLAIYPRLGVTREFFVLGSTFWCFFPLFLCGGVVVALVLCHARERFHRVYAVDLVAASLGCLVAIWLLNALTPVEAMLTVVAILPLAAGALFALAAGRKKLATAGFAVTLLALLSGQLLTDIPRLAKPPSLWGLNWEVAHSVWDAQSAVHVYAGNFFWTWSLSETYQGPRFPMLIMMIDGVGGTSIVAFDGNPQSLRDYDYLDYDLTALGQSLVGPEGRQLVVGPGGGVDLLQAVRAGREEITAVEIHPLVVQVVNEDISEFSGRPYELPGVEVHVENARTFIKRSRDQWDLISLTWVDTGGSATAMAASENYLYTVEAYQEFLEHLAADGMMAFTRALGMRDQLRVDSMRGVAVAVEALERLGIDDVGGHLIVAGSFSPYFKAPMCYTLIKRSPFTGAEIAEAREFFERMAFEPIWLPDGGPEPSSIPEPYSLFSPIIRQIITTSDREALYREASFDIAATTDDRPFYFVERGGPGREAGEGVRQLRAYLDVLLAVLIPFLGLPLIPVARRTRKLGGPGVAALGYFSVLGVAFMLVEIEMFHLFALVLGSPTLALATVLAGLLLFSGLGSLSGKRLASSGPAVIAAAFGGLVVLLVVLLLARTQLLDWLVVLPLEMRVFGTIAVVAPIAFCMGLPMSTGMRLVRHRPDIVLWGWALNGTCSVLASVAAIYLAIHIGIPLTFAVGAVCYALAGVLIQVFKSKTVAA